MNRPASGRRVPRAIVLVGFMGAGKTSVGQALSELLGWSFEDLDNRIEAREGRSIAGIFRQLGEAGFRHAEACALQELVSEIGERPRIVALGGGAFAQAENRAVIEKAGLTSVFLDAPVEELLRRCQQEDRVRPLRGNAQNFCDLYKARQRFYKKAGLRVDTDNKDIQAIAAEIAQHLGLGDSDVKAP